GNAALSRNKILDFDEHVEDWDKGETIIHYDNSTLAYSPSAILNGFIDVNLGAFRASWHTGYVSRMYLDNTQNQDRSLPSYTTSDLNLSYTLKFPKFLREVVFGCNFSNIFDAHYAISGWVYSAIYESGGYTNGNRYYQIGFFPAAGFTAMGSVKIKF
ncbi:MAG: TonB-dependent receptor, partial [Candidatus Cryptobacteroides sp.]